MLFHQLLHNHQKHSSNSSATYDFVALSFGKLLFPWSSLTFPPLGKRIITSTPSTPKIPFANCTFLCLQKLPQHTKPFGLSLRNEHTPSTWEKTSAKVLKSQGWGKESLNVDVLLYLRPRRIKDSMCDPTNSLICGSESAEEKSALNDFVAYFLKKVIFWTLLIKEWGLQNRGRLKA